MDGSLTLLGLYAASFLSATLLPGGSELILYALLQAEPARLWPALLGATVANTLGGLTSYLLGGLLRRARMPQREVRWLGRWGAPLLLLSWVPVAGDALCVAAGWARVGWAPAVLFIGLGKLVRYAVVAAAALA